MMTLFSVPKVFRGHIGVIQANAIVSWSLLRPECEILLLGRDAGTEEMAGRVGAIHRPGIRTNEFGTPIMDSVFEAAHQAARHRLLGFVNADVVLTNDILGAAERVRTMFPRFLLIARRWNLEIRENLGFANGWVTELRDRIRRFGRLEPAYGGSDIFIFPRGQWETVPPFAIGRGRFDSWLIYDACRRRIPVVDATGATWVVHQRHGYEHHPDGETGVWDGPEARENLQLLGGYHCIFTALNASHQLTEMGVVPTRPRSLAHALRRLATLPALCPAVRPLATLLPPLRRFWKRVKPES